MDGLKDNNVGRYQYYHGLGLEIINLNLFILISTIGYYRIKLVNDYSSSILMNRHQFGILILRFQLINLQVRC